jgi:hypothetical protein
VKRPSILSARLRPVGAAVAFTVALGLAAIPTAGLASPDSAIEELPYCGTNVIPGNDDGSSPLVPLPFTLGFFGASYSSLYVNNNGNVTFSSALGQYTPHSLQGSQGVPPMIAPFFADVDTRSGNGTVTYGESPDGSAFCVNWSDVGYYSVRSNKLNTFQLILTSRAGTEGRSAEDFDIQFNYGSIAWETGEASGGSNGLGGTSAAAGYTAGTGEAGTYFQIDGSLENGALLDGGPKSLISRSQSSQVQGRFNFEVRNDGPEHTVGTLTGRVINDRTGQGVAGALVDIRADRASYWTRTLADGSYSLSSVRPGIYAIRVQTTGPEIAAPVSAEVVAGAVTQAPDIHLRVPAGLPPDGSATLTNGTWNITYNSAGVPNLYWTQPLTLTVRNQCAGATASYEVTVRGATVRSGMFTENPPGTYTANIAPLYPLSGSGQIIYTITCPSGESTTVIIDIYIDPSGVIVDRYGTPITGAIATLLRSDTSDGVFEAIPDGSDLLAPSTRTNPQVTAADGRFYWDAVLGWYRIQVEVPGAPAYLTPAYRVDPERTAMVLEIPGVPNPVQPVPTSEPAISGTLQTNQTLTLDPGLWEGDVTIDSVGWQIGANTVSGPSLAIPAGAAGSEVSAVIAGHRVVEGNVDGIMADDGQLHQFTFPFTRVIWAGVVEEPSVPPVLTPRGDTPPAPLVSAVSTDTVVLLPVEGVEYAIGEPLNWQTGSVFSGLSAGTPYSFYARYAQTATNYPSAHSAETVAVTLGSTSGTRPAPSAPQVDSVTAETVALTPIAGAEYAIGRPSGWQSSPVFTGLSANTDYVFYARMAPTPTLPASDPSAPTQVRTALPVGAVDVATEAEFKAAVRDASVTFIRLTQDITMKKNDTTYTFAKKRADVVIDGVGPDGVRHTLSEATGNTAIGAGILGVRNANTDISSITLQNIDIEGTQEYGIVHIYDLAGNNITVTFDNVNYRGPALAVAYGTASNNTVVVKDSTIVLDPTASKYDRASEAVSSRHTVIEGNVDITRYGSAFNEDYDEIFLLLYKNSDLVLANQAQLTVDNQATPATHKLKSLAAWEYSGLIGTWAPSADTSKVVMGDMSVLDYQGTGPVVDDLVRENSSLAQLASWTVGRGAELLIDTTASTLGKKFPKTKFHNSYFDVGVLNVQDSGRVLYNWAGPVLAGEQLLYVGELNLGQSSAVAVAAPGAQANPLATVTRHNAVQSVNLPNQANWIG